MSHALLFPGQGAQFAGMAADLFESHAVARQLFERANERVPWDLMKLSFEGPEEDLAQTEVCQVAIYVASLAVWEVWKELASPPEPVVSAGLSLGEYTALTEAGALSFEEGLELVARRGKLMQEACDAAAGTMASVIGLSAAEVEEAVGATEGVVTVANYNSPMQFVLSGEVEAVRAAGERCKEKGAKRVLELKVAGAYHSPLMSPAAEALRPHLEMAAIAAPRHPVVLNLTGEATTDPEEIRQGLIRQVTHPVRWEASMGQLRGLGAERGVELGPGAVLRGLMRGLDRDFPVQSLCTEESIQEAARE